MSRIAGCILILLVAPSPAVSQQGPIPRVHLGAQLPALDPWPAGGGRFEFRRNARESLEITLDWRGDIDSGDFVAGPDPRVIYSVSYKRRFFEGNPRTSWFVTIGGLGYYKPAGSPKILLRTKDGQVLARPIRRGKAFMPPVLPMVGAGVERLLGGRLGVHADVQLLPSNLLWHLHTSRVGPQIHVGIFIPLARR